ncbi:MAG: cupin domain-containing protein [Steroidobacteraceae bacterium]|nr:cupin domain-containing protein [Steroidobacteraceae bacterium]
MLLAGIALASAASFAGAAEPASTPADVATLMTRDLGGIPGKEGLMLTVEYPPGGSSPPHRHDANVFVYVLEGSVIMQVEGKDAVTLRPGDTFYESPTDVHLKSANASQTEPAKILVVMVKDKGKPASRAVTAHH